MTHATPAPLAGAPPLEDPAPPLEDPAPPLEDPAPPLPVSEPVQTGQFVVAHSSTAVLALSHALETCEVPPPEPELQLEQKLEYCELHLLSTQLTQPGGAADGFCTAAQVELLSELLQPSPLKPPIKAKKKGISLFMRCVLVRVQCFRATLPPGI